MTPVRPGPAVTDDAIRAARMRADAEGIINEVHAYCATRCPRRERCPGMACRQYQREMAARDTLFELEDAR